MFVKFILYPFTLINYKNKLLKDMVRADISFK